MIGDLVKKQFIDGMKLQTWDIPSVEEKPKLCVCDYRFKKQWKGNGQGQPQAYFIGVSMHWPSHFILGEPKGQKDSP